MPPGRRVQPAEAPTKLDGNGGARPGRAGIGLAQIGPVQLSPSSRRTGAGQLAGSKPW